MLSIVQTLLTRRGTLQLIATRDSCAAEIWFDGNCEINKPAQCEKCCVDSATGYTVPDCDCQEWTDKCHAAVFQWGKVLCFACMRFADMML